MLKLFTDWSQIKTINIVLVCSLTHLHTAPLKKSTKKKQIRSLQQTTNTKWMKKNESNQSSNKWKSALLNWAYLFEFLSFFVGYLFVSFHSVSVLFQSICIFTFQFLPSRKFNGENHYVHMYVWNWYTAIKNLCMKMHGTQKGEEEGKKT